MTCRIHFYLLNDHFSQEYADAHNNGEPSEMNRLYLWEDEFAIKTEVTAIDVRENDHYPLMGTNESGDYSFEIAEMRLFYLMQGETPVAVVGCSERLLADYAETTEADEIVLKVNLKGEEPLANPITGIYIASAHFPEALIRS